MIFEIEYPLISILDLCFMMTFHLPWNGRSSHMVLLILLCSLRKMKKKKHLRKRLQRKAMNFFRFNLGFLMYVVQFINWRSSTQSSTTFQQAFQLQFFFENSIGMTPHLQQIWKNLSSYFIGDLQYTPTTKGSLQIYLQC
jgi:hypothetical protein